VEKNDSQLNGKKTSAKNSLLVNFSQGAYLNKHTHTHAHRDTHTDTQVYT